MLEVQRVHDVLGLWAGCADASCSASGAAIVEADAASARSALRDGQDCAQGVCFQACWILEPGSGKQDGQGGRRFFFSYLDKIKRNNTELAG